MAVRSLGWLGVRTRQAPAMTAFYRDVLQLEVILERPDATWCSGWETAAVSILSSNASPQPSTPTSSSRSHHTQPEPPAGELPH